MKYKSPTGAPEFAIDDDLKKELDILLNGVLNHNQDMVCVVDGEERSGKSQGTRQLALYCADQVKTPFDREGLGNVYTSMEAYISAFEKAQEKGIRGWVGVLDESRGLLGKARHNNREVKAFTDWLSECGDIGGVHFILLPRFHDLHKYVVLNRMMLLINLRKAYKKNESVLGGYELVLGGYKVYSNDFNLHQAYFAPYNYPRQWATQGTFSNVEIMTPKGLAAITAQKKKDRDERRQANGEKGLDRSTIHLNGLLAVLQEQGHQPAAFARIFGVTRQALTERLKAGRQTVVYARWKKSQSAEGEEVDE